MQKRYIYVILTQSVAKTGKMIQMFTKAKYSHASISLDKDLNKMYSFARLKYHTPLVAGFTKENIDTLSLGHEDKVNVKVFRIPVTNNQYKKLERNIEYFKQNSARYKYNFFKLIFYLTPFEFKIKDTYVCTEFVSECLASVGIKRKKILKNKLLPTEIIEILKEYEYYSGDLLEYAKTINHSCCSSNFFEKENIFVMMGKTIKQIIVLLYRKII